MRQHKFRAKDLRTGKWKIGSLVWNGYEFSNAEIHSYSDKGGWLKYQVDTKTIGEYTGLSDKEGTEIYEGDRLSDSGSAFLVEWNTCNNTVEKGISSESYIVGFVRRWADGSIGSITPFKLRNSEVIGNIHDEASE